MKRLKNIGYRGAAIALALALGGCGTLPQRTVSPAPAQPAAAPAAEAQAVPSAERRAEPTLYRGNDQVVRLPAGKTVQVQGEAVTLDFEATPLADVVHAILGDLLKLEYSIHPPLKGEVTLHTHKAVPRTDVLAILESLVQANGLLLVRDGAGLYHVGTPEALKPLAAGPHRVETMPAGYGLVIMPLRYIGAQEMADILKPVAPAEAFVRVDTTRNLLLLAGTRGQIEGWREIVDSFDVDLLQGMSVGVFPLEHANVGELKDAIGTLLASGEGEGGEGPLRGVVRVLPIERLNSLLVVTPRAHYLEQVRQWIERLDRPLENDIEPRLYVYPVQNGSAAHLAALLNGLYGGTGAQAAGTTTGGVAPGLAPSRLSSPATGAAATAMTPAASSSSSGSGTPAAMGTSSVLATAATTGAAAGAANDTAQVTQVALEGDVRVVADEKNNALIIRAPRSQYRKIESALRQLDQAPTQVLIEASIVEVSLTGELKYGVDWQASGLALSSGYSGALQINMNSSGGIAPQQPGFSYAVTHPGGELRAVLNALSQKTELNVLSNPTLLVLDNHTAMIHVGQQQPIRSAETVTTGGNTTTSIQYKDTGILLAVTPSVNAGGLVSMALQQTVTDVGEVDAATGQRSFLQRQVQSRVAVRSGETVVLGGLIRDNRSQGHGGVPGLSDIPILGALFGSTLENNTRTELLIMITPRVLQDDSQLREVSEELKTRMQGLRAVGRMPGA